MSENKILPTVTISGMGSQERFAVSIAVLITIVSLLGLLLDWPVTFPLDDAYITLHNARTLLEGQDPNFGVSALVGATSAVHLALLAGLGLFLDLPLASFLLNALATIIYGVGLARLTLQIQPSQWVAAGIVGLGLFAADAPYHLFNGLETGLAMAVVVWGIVLTLTSSRVLLPLLCGLMPFIRPELAALACSLLGWRAWKFRSTPSYIFVDIGFASVAAAPWLLWYWTTTEHWMPTTASAKQAFFAEQGYPLWLKLLAVVGIIGNSSLGFILVALVFIRRSSLAIPAVFFVGAFLAAFTLTFPGGLAHNFFRYLYPLLPIALFGLVTAARDSRAIAWGVALLCLLYTAIGFSSWPHVTSGRRFTVELDEVAQWAQKHLPSTARVLIHDAGYLAWATPFALVDLVGLKTPASIEVHRRWTQPSSGRDRHEAVHAIANRSRVTHAVILNAEFWGDLADDLRRQGWRLEPLREPTGLGYVVYELTPPVS